MQRLYEQFIPEHYSVHWDLTKAAKRTVTGSVTITGQQLTENTISLHAKDIVMTKLAVNGSEADYAAGENDELIIDHKGAGDVTIAAEFTLDLSDSMHGIYPCYFEHEGKKKELYATQFESHHAREAFPCIDEPEAKATFDVSLATASGIEVLSNMPIGNQKKSKDSTTTTFERSPHMSSYLLAFAVGELHKTSGKTKSGVEVNVWATPAQRIEALTFALEHAIKTIEFFDEYFDTPYPLPKSDHVALPDFSAGAMENWGLITYREVALLADPATTTVAGKQYIATVISHELSHQWFGNLVTMKWWNNLWLNESFAAVMEYVAVDGIHPEWNSWLDFATNDCILALRRDAIDGVQAVQVEVNHPDEISSIFDGAIVYAKGARLIRMCQDFIGHEAFRKGLASYFKEFAYKNTEADNLWRHLSEASGQDISRFMNTWITQSGYPVLHVNSDGLRQEQFFIGAHEPSNKLWPIPLGAESAEDVPALLETAELKLPIADDERFNIHDSAHFLTHYTPEHLERLLAKVTSFSELGRLQLLHEQSLLARGGIIPSANLVGLLHSYKNEAAQNVWNVMAVAFGELKKFVETDEAAEAKLREFSAQLARPLFTKLGWEIIDGESEEDTKLRSLILGMMMYGEDKAVLTKADKLYACGLESIDPEVRSLVVSSVVRRSEDPALVTSLLETYRNTHSADLRDDICSGITSVKSPELVSALMKQLTDSKTIRRQDMFRWFAYLIRNRYARDATWQWMQTNWEWIEETFGGDKSYDDFPRYAANGLMTREQLESYKAFFTPKRDAPALVRNIDLGIKEIEGRIELIERDGRGVRARLLAL